MLTVHRIPYSTNVERVSLAAAHKGLDVEWVDHDPGDRSAIAALSGQELVPVLQDGDLVVVDSSRIVEHLEAGHPTPPLFPAEAGARAWVELFVEWFDEVWKRAPNRIAAEWWGGSPDEERVARDGRRMAGRMARFADLLDGSPFLAGERLTAADIAAYPFLRYAVQDPEPGDEHPFHAALVTYLRPGLAALAPAARGRFLQWVRRMDAQPRA